MSGHGQRDDRVVGADYLIIGGGIIGCATAMELARRGARVAVVDRGRLGGESTWAGGGILSPLLPWDYPGPVTRLTAWSAGLYPQWVAGLIADTGLDPEYLPDGMLVLPPFERRKAVAWGEAHGMRVEQVAAHRIMPELERSGEALWLPGVAQVRNPRLAQVLARWLELRGVEVIDDTEVRRILFADNRISGVETSRGEMTAATYIVAAGAWSAGLLGELAPPVVLNPVRGQMLLFRIAPGALSRVVMQNGIYLIPRKDGHVLAGSTLENAGFDKSTTEEAATLLRRVAGEIFPGLRGQEPVMHWAGLRPGSPHNIPVIDRHPHMENLYLNTGHFRYGVTMAPGSALLLASRIFREEPPVHIAPYDWPGR